ncbi:MAG: hypothetical protein KKB20_14815, partial [Proteobacteria bacterium]|nr:hypothetical protein [Pseudomonadota bacterium]
PYPPSVRLNPGAYAEWASRLGSESSAGNMLRRSETAAELAAAWGETPGLVDLLAPIDPGAGLEAARLARLAETRRGPLTEAEIYILLMDELARVRA